MNYKKKKQYTSDDHKQRLADISQTAKISNITIPAVKKLLSEWVTLSEIRIWEYIDWEFVCWNIQQVIDKKRLLDNKSLLLGKKSI